VNGTNAALLAFNPELNKLGKGKALRQGLSVVVQIGNTLWVTNDETISLERLTGSKDSLDTAYLYNEHTQFALSDYLSLPVPPPPDPDEIEEADLEGLDYKDGYLWLVGSHSLKRKQADKKSVKKNFKRLAKVGRDGNRYLLARIPVVERDGTVTLAKEAHQNGKTLTAARLPGNDRGNDLTKALAKDNHLRRSLKIPGKENGFDIEGLAVGENQRLFVGLRGPVLRGWAVILELQPKTDGDNPAELRLKHLNPNNPHNPKNPTYRKHFLDLGGLAAKRRNVPDPAPENRRVAARCRTHALARDDERHSQAFGISTAAHPQRHDVPDNLERIALDLSCRNRAHPDVLPRIDRTEFELDRGGCTECPEGPRDRAKELTGKPIRCRRASVARAIRCD